MHKFSYLCPHSVAEACAYLARYGKQAKIMAGGTDLIIKLRDAGPELRDVAYVIDISFLDELKMIRETSGHIIVGALTTHEEMADSPVIRGYLPSLAQACSLVGSPQIRNRGTLGGNIINASPAADTVPVLLSLDASLSVTSLAGEETVGMGDIFQQPYRTKIKPEELLTKIIIPKPPAGCKMVFEKLARRNSLAISRMNVAVLIKTDQEGRVSLARIVPGSVTPLPQRFYGAEEILIGKQPDAGLLHRVGEAAAGEMIRQSGVRSSTAYKKPVLHNLVVRAVEKALGVRKVNE